MPEGDAIFRTARALDRALAGRTLTGFQSMLPHLTRVDEDQPLAGRIVERVRAAGKHVLVELSGNLVLRTHMRMNGSWHVYRTGERWRRPRPQMRIVLETDAYTAVAFNVPVAEFVRGRDLSRHPTLGQLGPDLLAASFDLDAAVERLRREDTRRIAEALLDQRVVAGIGNVYKSEVCFLCRVNPFDPVVVLHDDQLRCLLSTARRLLQANVGPSATGQIVTRRTLRSMTGRADPEGSLWVYGRAGRPCRRCSQAIRRAVQGEQARSTYWCARCAPPASQAGSSSEV
jgi:endonuclease-8